MKLSVHDVYALMGDALLVEVLPLPDMVGTLHVPESAKSERGRRKSWRGKVVLFGEGVDYDQWKPYTVSIGSTVVLSPESFECPGFDDEDKRYVIVRDEDVLGMECEVDLTGAAYAE